MRRLLTGIAGALGVAALWRLLGRRRGAVEQPRVEQPSVEQPSVQQPRGEQPGVQLPGVGLPGADPAEELRHKLAEARESRDDREEFDAAEGTPVDEAEAPPPAMPGALDERRRAVHEQAQEALGRMQQDPED